MSKVTRTNTAAKQTTKQAKPADMVLRAEAALAARDEADEGEHDAEQAQGVSQWSREMARRAEGKGNACRRFDALALALAMASNEGKTSVTFADANLRSGLARGERGNPVASWRLAVQRMRQSFGGTDAFAATMGYSVTVDAEAGKLVLEKHA